MADVLKGNGYLMDEDGQLLEIVDQEARDKVKALTEEMGNKLNSSELTTAVNGALEQAKASGEFKGEDGKDGKDGSDGKAGEDGISPTVSVSKSGKVTTISIFDKNGMKTETVNDGEDGSPGAAGINGKDGTSVTVANVTQSTEDGGSNVVTFSDGKILSVKNGSKGSQGNPGNPGKDGTSVTVASVNTSSTDGGSNVVTFSDGKTMTVKNGSKGSQGEQGPEGPAGSDGKDGYTPVAGVDYFNEADKAELVEQVKRSSNPLNGKKVSFLGDSICAGGTESTSYLGGYGKIIADRNSMVYENVAHGGATVTAETYSRTTGNPKPWLCRMIENMSADADYAIIEGGLNDGWDETVKNKIGALSTGYNAVLDDTTYYGAFESMLKQLVTKFQGKKIGYIAVPKIHNLYDSEQNVPNFYHISMECCAKWGVPVCDLNTISPPVEYLKTFGTTYTADGTHPTYEGYLKYYCDPIEAWMKTLITGGNSAAGMALKAVDSATKEMNASIAALQTGKLNNTGVSFRRAILNLADGTSIEIDVLTAVDGSAVIPFVNRMPISIDTDGSVYNGVGWKGDTRLSASSGSVKEDTNGAAITGFIPVKKGDIGRFKYTGTNLLWDTKPGNEGWNIIAYYDSSFTWLGSVCPLQNGGQIYGICTASDHSSGSVADGGIVSFTVPANDSIAYVRLSFATEQTEDLSGLIVTVNQEIT